VNRGPPDLPRPWKGTMMGTRTGRRLMTCGPVLAACAVLAAGSVLAACTAAPKGPDTTVTTPAVGRPPAPASAAAALSSEAFTSYAGLGAVDNDGLAPGDTYDALHTACMNDDGYGQYASEAPYPVRANRALAFPQAYGPWGYIGTALAAQQGFLAGISPAPGTGGPGAGPGAPGSPFGDLPTGAQAAAGKCFNILANFNNAQFAHSMALIETLNNYISTDVIQDGEFKQAMRNWSACMARNGFSSSDADTFSQQALITLGQRPAPGRTLPARPARRPPRRTRRRSRWPWPTRTAR
jgi:hypothetical protein